MFHVNETSDGLRNLCLGRVLLKTDYVVGAVTLPTGRAATASAAAIPGTGFFRRQATAVTVVQPGATDTPSDIEHQEDATITDPVGGPLNLTIAAALTKAYTVARGAYVRLKTLPTVCGTLQMIAEDFVEGAMDPEDKLFPGVFVSWQGTEWESMSQGVYKEASIFLVRYGMIAKDETNNRQDLVTATGQLVNIISESNDLGGNVYFSKVTRAVPHWSDISRTPNRSNIRQTAAGHGLLWSDIFVECWRAAAWDKISTT
jgi:hypothetical protein